MLRYPALVGAICCGLGPVAAPATAQYTSPGVAASEAGEPAGLSPVYSIRNLQEALNVLGYEAGIPDGRVGPRTRGAVREFQAANGLPVTGEPSATLYDRLLAAAAEPAQAGAGTASADVAQPSREATTAVQSELRRRGYTIDAVTGDLDAQTRNAIMQYQADAGMAVTGQPSAALLAHMRASGPQQGPDRLQLVRSIQDELNRRGYDAGPADGVLGPKTRSAIRAYQSDAGLPVTGDPSESLLAGLRGAATSQAAVAPDGDRALVRDIQAELKQRGFYAGEVDGTLDGPTEAAIRSYQAAMRMPQTGEASVDLLASLRISDRGQGGMMASDLVRDVERALRSRGYAVPAVDGILDAGTSAAIRDYQRSAGLPIDGQPSQALLAHIERSDVRAAARSGPNGNDPQPDMRRFLRNLGETGQ